MAKSKELPGNRSLWRVRVALPREGGHTKDEVTRLLRLSDAYREMEKLKQNGLKDVEIVEDEVAVARYREDKSA